MTLRAILLVALLAACAAPPASEPSDGLFYPRHGSPYGQGEMAGLEGMLAFRDGCLLIDTADGASVLPIWPSDTMPGVINSLPVILMEDSLLLTETGEPRNFGGSEVDHAGAAELAGPIPERCAAGRYWLVTRIDPAR